MRVMSDSFRQHLVLKPEKTVTVGFDPVTYQDGSTALVARFYCTSCDDDYMFNPMDWDSEKEWWSCGICESEMTATESVILLHEIQSALSLLAQEANIRIVPPKEKSKEKNKWGWRNLFGSRKKETP